MGKRLFAANIPEPIKLFANYAILEYNDSDKIKMLFSANIIGAGGEMNIGFVNDYTYYQYLQKRISSINMLKHSCFFLLNDLLNFSLLSIQNEEGKEYFRNAAVSNSIKEKIDTLSTTDFFQQKLNKYVPLVMSINEVYESIMKIQFSREIVNTSIVDSFEISMKYDLKSAIEQFISLIRDYEELIAK